MNTTQTAARPSIFKKLALSIGLVLISTVYALWQSFGGEQPVTTASAQATTAQSYKAANEALLQTLTQISNPVPSSTGRTTASVSKTAPASAPVPAPAPQKPAGQYVDGSYTGSQADAYYGTVQVEAIIQNGQLADVKFLQYPDTHSTSVYINEQVMPMLVQEAIQAQNANVNGVSGATFTSQAFVQSLASALTQAKA